MVGSVGAPWTAGGFSSPTLAVSFSPLAGRSTLSGVGRSGEEAQSWWATVGACEARIYGGDPDWMATRLRARVEVLDAAEIAARRRMWRWPEPDRVVLGCIHVGERHILIRRGLSRLEHLRTLAHELAHIVQPTWDEGEIKAWSEGFEREAYRLGQRWDW